MSLLHADQRYAELVNWLSHGLKLDIQQIQPASSDASFRRYFRVFHSAGQHIVMDAPPKYENTAAFIRVAELFATTGIHVPKIHQKQPDLGFLLLEDLGSTSLLDGVNADNADRHYQQALDSLFLIQTGVDISRCGLAEYDQVLLTRELNIFAEWFLEKGLDIVLPNAVQSQIYSFLINSALEQPQVCVHRDYHSRNLMLITNNSPGVIDFQDAVIGPISYDLVSLLRDCYIVWPQNQVEDWTLGYFQRLTKAGLLNGNFQQFKRWFDLMGMQRHLKAVGIFSRLHLRDNKSAYLADIPRTLAYITAVCTNYAELNAFAEFLQHQVLPIYRTAICKL